MQQEIIDKVVAETKDKAWLRELPAKEHGFALRQIGEVHEDMFDLFAYENEALHRSVTAYFHAETQEYKLRLRIGFVEFCRMEYITPSVDTFGELLHAQLPALLLELCSFDPKTISSMVLRKGILSWEFGKELPETLEGYELFIRPAQPVRVNNGSCIIIDYVDFVQECDVTIYYNMYRDEFFGEARIHHIPDVTYDFDSTELDELQQKLERYLVPRLKEARERAIKEAS